MREKRTALLGALTALGGAVDRLEIAKNRLGEEPETISIEMTRAEIEALQAAGRAALKEDKP